MDGFWFVAVDDDTASGLLAAASLAKAPPRMTAGVICVLPAFAIAFCAFVFGKNRVEPCSTGQLKAAVPT